MLSEDIRKQLDMVAIIIVKHFKDALSTKKMVDIFCPVGYKIKS